jgi:hypothetical protein
MPPALAAVLAFTPRGVDMVTVDREAAPSSDLRLSGGKKSRIISPSRTA